MPTLAGTPLFDIPPPQPGKPQRYAPHKNNGGVTPYKKGGRGIVKYHENIHGDIVECRATKEPCHKQHVDANSIEEARTQHEQLLAREYGATPTPPKPSPALFACRRDPQQAREAIKRTITVYRQGKPTPPRGAPKTTGRYRGAIKTGQVKRTRGQIKKHYTQMSPTELETIHHALKRINPDTIHESRHLTTKKHREGLTVPMGLIRDTLRNPDTGVIIEYNHNPSGESRVLIRSKRVQDVTINGRARQCQLCFVIAPTAGRVQTAYWNLANDKHQHVDMSRYDASLPVRF